MIFDDFDTQIQSDELGEDIMEYNESMPCAPTMQKTLYYDMPTQVKFFDFDGETIEISELYDIAEEIELGEDLIEVPNWIDINAEIKGE